MTNILLTLIAVLLAVRIVLQIRQGKRAFEKGYCAPSEVENIVKIVNDSNTICDVTETLEWASVHGFELVSADRLTSNTWYFFFTRKKIKNFYEE